MSSDYRKLSFLLSGFLVSFVLTALVVYTRIDVSWEGWRRPSCYPACFCEAFHPGAMVQPQSSYSNLAFVVVGVTIISAACTARPDKGSGTHYLCCRWGYSIGYGTVVAAVGCASLFYHISLTQLGQFLDYIGMYLFTSFVVLYQLVRLEVLPEHRFVISYLTLNAGLAGWLAAMLSIRRILFVVLVALIVVLEVAVYFRKRFVRIQPVYLVGAFAFFGIAMTFNLLDENGIICRPEYWWQWHTVWHLLLPVAMGMLYLYFLSEVFPAESLPSTRD